MRTIYFCNERPLRVETKAINSVLRTSTNFRHILYAQAESYDRQLDSLFICRPAPISGRRKMS